MDLDPLQRLLAERACERVILDFVRRLDLGEPSSVAELFTEDGTWEWPDGERLVEGRGRCGSTSVPVPPGGSHGG